MYIIIFDMTYTNNTVTAIDTHADKKYSITNIIPFPIKIAYLYVNTWLMHFKINRIGDKTIVPIINQNKGQRLLNFSTVLKP